MRTQRNNITLDVDSALALMQEIYNDVVENRNTASTILRKMMTFMKDAEDMSTIGPVIKEQQKILNDCTEKKISLVKLQSVLLKQTTGGGSGGGGSMGKLTLSDEDREILDRLVNDGGDNKTSNYSL
jgi:mevalonate kinase